MSDSDCRSLKRSVQDRVERIAEGDAFLVDAVQRTLNTAERKGCISKDERDTILSELQDLARTQNTGLVPEINSDIDQAFGSGKVEAPTAVSEEPSIPLSDAVERFRDFNQGLTATKNWSCRQIYGNLGTIADVVIKVEQPPVDSEEAGALRDLGLELADNLDELFEANDCAEDRESEIKFTTRQMSKAFTRPGESPVRHATDLQGFVSELREERGIKADNPGNPGNPHNNPNSNDDEDEDFGSLEPQREEPERQRTLTGERAEGETGPQPAESRERARGRGAFEEGQETLGQVETERLTEFEEEEGNPNGGEKTIRPTGILRRKAREARDGFIGAWEEVKEKRGEPNVMDVHGETLSYLNKIVENEVVEAKPSIIDTLIEDAREINQEAGPSIGAVAPLDELKEVRDALNEIEPIEPRNTANFGGLILELTTGVPEHRVNEMEDSDRRARAERTIEGEISDVRISTGLEGNVREMLDEARVALGPAGSIMGVKVDLREDRVTGTALEQVVEVVDEAVEDVTGATIERRERIAPDRPEWEISCR